MKRGVVVVSLIVLMMIVVILAIVGVIYGEYKYGKIQGEVKTSGELDSTTLAGKGAKPPKENPKATGSPPSQDGPLIPDPGCSDTDGGENYFVKGEACDYSKIPTSLDGEPICGEDYCVDFDTVYEYVCDQQGFRTVEYDCNYGCLNGECTSSTVLVEDFNQDITNNGNVVLESIDSVSWDGDSSYYPDGGALIRSSSEGLVALYHMDNEPYRDIYQVCGSDPFADPYEGIIEDSSGNGYHGYCYYPQPTCESECPEMSFRDSRVGGGSYYFHAENGGIDVINYDVSGSELSIAYWAKYNSYFSNDQYHFLKDDVNGEDLWGVGASFVYIEEEDPEEHYFPMFVLKTDDGNEATLLTGDETVIEQVVPGSWYHVAGVYDGTNMILYMNGQEIARVMKTGQIMTDSEGEVRLGLNNAQTYYLDELGVWDRVLSPGEIIALSSVGGEGVANSYRTVEIDYDTFYQVNVGWVESGDGVDIVASTDGGNTWCELEDRLTSNWCVLPSNSFMYRMTFSDQTNLDELHIELDTVYECNDGVDNDHDGATDDDDFACQQGSLSEDAYKSQCQDGVDNEFGGDGDGWIDLVDPGCSSNQDNSENFVGNTECSDEEDSDSDGFIDGHDSSCDSPQDITESSQCNNGIDDDSDGLTDYEEDVDCSGPHDDSEEAEAEFTVQNCGFDADVPGTYTLQDGLNTNDDCLKVSSERVIINGAGNVISGAGVGAGIHLEGVNGVAVRNLRIENFEVGVIVNSSNESSVIGTTINGVNQVGGIYVDKSDLVVIEDNVVENNVVDGIFVYDSDDIFVKGNILRSNLGSGFMSSGNSRIREFKDNIIEDNQEYGANILFLKENSEISGNQIRGQLNSDGLKIGSNKDLIIEDNLIENNDGGLVISSGSERLNVLNNNIRNNLGTGLSLENIHTRSSSVIVSQNTLTGNQGHGIYTWNANGEGLEIFSNTISDNSNTGILFTGTDYVEVYDNTISGGVGGISLTNSQRNTISGNQISLIIGSGIKLYSGSNYNDIIDNQITQVAGDGIGINYGRENDIIGNVIESPSLSGIKVLSGDNNRVIGNNIISSGSDSLKIFGLEDNSATWNYFEGNQLSVEDENIANELSIAGVSTQNTEFYNSDIGSFEIRGEGHDIIVANANGEVNFYDPINGDGDDFNAAINVDYNSIFVDSENYPGFNQRGNVKLNSLPDYQNLVVLKDRSPCPIEECELVRFVDNEASINVFSWSEISTGEEGQICGDGLITNGEECDDQNGRNGDGCSSTCIIEDGWTCINEPSECTPFACADGEDNDGDGYVDFGSDIGCDSLNDDDESNAVTGFECSDGIDNEGDGFIDGNDPMCVFYDDVTETAACQNNLDDDGDGLIDFPNDLGCIHINDNSEEDMGALGEQRVAAILIDYRQDGQEQDWQEYYDAFFDHYNPLEEFDNDFDEFFRRMSYGKTWLTGDVYGWYLGSGESCFPTSEAISLADPDIDFTQVDRIVVISRVNDVCENAGYSSFGKVLVDTDEGLIRASTSVVVDDMMYDPQDFSRTRNSVVAHEMMHGFGIPGHANNYDCGDSILDTNWNNCEQYALGDQFDIMGNGYWGANPSSCHKEELGWLDADLGELDVYNGFGDYIFESINLDTGFPKGLRIDLGTPIRINTVDGSERYISKYYIEYKSPHGWDKSRLNGLASGSFGAPGPQDINGVTLRGALFNEEGECTTTYLLDADPETHSDENDPSNNDFVDHFLLEGMVFEDPTNGLQIETTEIAAGRATVRISEFQEQFIPIDTCQILNQAGGNYRLTQSVNSDGTCFIITQDDITFDGGGNIITLNNGALSDSAVSATGRTGLEIKNFIVDNSGQQISTAVHFSSVSNSIIDGINTNGIGRGMFLQNSFDNTIRNSVIDGSRVQGIQLFGSSTDNNLIDSVIIRNRVANYDVWTTGGTDTHYNDVSFENYRFSPGTGELLIFSNDEGKIEFNDVIEADGLSHNIGNEIIISNNFAEVNIGLQSAFNKPAHITLRNLQTFSNPVVLRNGVECSPSVCTGLVINEDEAQFDVTSWSVYSIGEASVGPPGGGKKPKLSPPSEDDFFLDRLVYWIQKIRSFSLVN